MIGKLAGITAFSRMIERGGVYYNVSGSSPIKVLTEGISSIDLPSSIDRTLLLEAVLQRESLMPTAIGNGIAIPHPRNPLIHDIDEQRVCTLFLTSPVNWNALDRIPVTVLFLILSADARSHLAILAELGHVSRKPEFKTFLSTRPSTEELTGYLRDVESRWVSE